MVLFLGWTAQLSPTQPAAYLQLVLCMQKRTAGILDASQLRFCIGHGPCCCSHGIVKYYVLHSGTPALLWQMPSLLCSRHGPTPCRQHRCQCGACLQMLCSHGPPVASYFAFNALSAASIQASHLPVACRYGPLRASPLSATSSCHGIPISLPTTASLQHLTVPAADGAPYERMPSATSSGCGGSKSQSGDLLRLPSGNSQSGPPALDLSQSGSLAQELPVQRSPSNTIDEGDIVRQALEGTSVHK